MEVTRATGQPRSRHDQEGVLPPGAWNVVADEPVVGSRGRKLHLGIRALSPARFVVGPDVHLDARLTWQAAG